VGGETGGDWRVMSLRKSLESKRVLSRRREGPKEDGITADKTGIQRYS
jgi:hypothetical protein